MARDGTAGGGEDQGNGGPPARAGFVALLGAPNAGKSTLVNALVGSKVSIVTHKVQTTRGIVRGIVRRGAAQIVLVDMPGVFADPRRPLEKAMVSGAWSHARDADVVIVLVDARRGDEPDVLHLLERSEGIGAPRILVLNKVDLVRKPGLLALAERLNARHRFAATLMVSAETGDGLDDLLDRLAGRMPEGPWLYPEDQLSDMPLRSLAAEITREHLTRRLHEEIPYGLTVETEGWEERRDGSVRIDQTIIVERPGHKKIVIGRGGATLKQVSTAARGEIARLIEQPVHLFLFVKVRERWQEDPERYRDLNLDAPGRR